MIPRPRVLTIPASAPFLPTLIRAFLDDRLGLGFKPDGDPLALATATFYLPTRRACRLAQRVFLEMLGRDAAILPRIVPIGDVDEHEIAFAEAAIGETAGEALDLPRALDGLERLAPLAALILKWADAIAPGEDGQAPLVANNPTTAFALAQDLARLMDDMTTQRVAWERLADLVPDDLDRYWEQTLRFLKFIGERWPGILKDMGRIEPAERRDRLIAAEAARLANSSGPVIAAGSTGSMPATATLLATIAKLPQGALVLPGLDTELDAATWDLLGSGAKDADLQNGHPQFAMAGLLRQIGISRAEVVTLAEPGPHGRERLISEALRPAIRSDLWQQTLQTTDFATHVDRAMQDVAVIESANAEEEALAIAVVLREAMEVPHKTAALVTPDRALARRVLAALQRWNIEADDSAGDALVDTPEGVFARLAAEVGLHGLPPVPLLALLKHPLGGFKADAVAALERAILRGPRPKRGSAGLRGALQLFRGELTKLRRGEASALHPSDPRRTLTDRSLDAAEALIGTLEAALRPLESAPRTAQPFAALATRHRDVVAALGGMTAELADAFDEIATTAAELEVSPEHYDALFRAALAGRKQHQRETRVRVRIFGPLEARLQTVDRMVIGGLVEGVWPPQARTDPWLSRPMRHALGLDLPERRIGLSAHDFAEALGAREVVLSRAARQAGAPTVASRFVQRLAAVVGETRWAAALKRGERYVALARALDGPEGEPRTAKRPRPRPPLPARPMSLSVTEIEDWLRDPYTIYARRVLRLAPLDAIDTPPGAADRGIMIHGAIGDFTRLYAAGLPADAFGVLRNLGESRFAPLADFEEAAAFWWPRFLRIADWFTELFEPQRRAKIAALHAEIHGSIDIPLQGATFRLRGIADRVERLADGSFAILDYKTGKPPTAKQVRTGLAPQLTLEAAILRRGGFKDIPAGASVRELAYVALRGGDPPGREEIIDLEGQTPDAAAEHALKRLTEVAQKFVDEEMPYLSLVHPMWKRRYGDYDHLARVKEWSVVDDDENGGSA